MPYLPNDGKYRNLKTVYIVGQYFENSLDLTVSNDDIENLKLMLSLYGVTDSDKLRHNAHNFEHGEQKRGLLYFEYSGRVKLRNDLWIYEVYNKSITDEKCNLFNDKLNAYLEK